MKSTMRLVLAGLLLPLLCGALLPDCGGGLKSFDFVQICENGFSATDNETDHNDYAWSMEYFVPDGAETGYLYVGTSNSVVLLVLHALGVDATAYGVEQTETAPVSPPEIRRYRPDLGETTWERVFDYRDVETEDGARNMGFRFMTAYRAQSDGRNYLYAATYSDDGSLWRTATGEPGDWQQIWAVGDVGSVRWMEEHNGLLYLSIADDVPQNQPVGTVWATDGASFWPVITDGFGNPSNRTVACLASYNGWLYAGTANYESGYEVWKFAGPGGQGNIPVRVVDYGGPDNRNDIVGTPCVFQNKLYMGSMIWFGFNPENGNGFKGTDIIRINEDDTWETVVGPKSVGEVESGFGHFTNAYTWWMEEHGGWLYASTFDQSTFYPYIVENVDQLVGLMADGLPDVQLKREPHWMDFLFNAGADLYKSPDGVNWMPVFTDGLGDTGNYGIRTMQSVGETLYLGTANPFDGLEVWRGTRAGG